MKQVGGQTEIAGRVPLAVGARLEKFDIREYRDIAERSIEFILRHQTPEGAWPYAVESAHDSFVDNIHTCFVLKNLFKSNRTLQSTEIRDSIDRGYKYYRDHCFSGTGLPFPFAKLNRPNFVKVETYDVAEGISLGVLLNNTNPDALGLAYNLARFAIEQLQLPDGHFITRISKVGLSNKVPYIRWPQAQMFNALTSLLLQAESNEGLSALRQDLISK